MLLVVSGVSVVLHCVAFDIYLRFFVDEVHSQISVTCFVLLNTICRLTHLGAMPLYKSVTYSLTIVKIPIISECVQAVATATSRHCQW